MRSGRDQLRKTKYRVARQNLQLKTTFSASNSILTPGPKYLGRLNTVNAICKILKTLCTQFEFLHNGATVYTLISSLIDRKILCHAHRSAWGRKVEREGGGGGGELLEPVLTDFLIGQCFS